jgi:hypothetical protein
MTELITPLQVTDVTEECVCVCVRKLRLLLTMHVLCRETSLSHCDFLSDQSLSRSPCQNAIGELNAVRWPQINTSLYGKSIRHSTCIKREFVFPQRFTAPRLAIFTDGG